MSDNLRLSVDKVRVLETSNKAQLARVEIWIVASGRTENTWVISEGSIDGAVDTVYGKPVLAKYNKYKKDFMGHEHDEVAVGVFLTNGRIEVGEDGRKWIVAEAVIWKRYYPEVMEVFERKSGQTEVSAEIQVMEPQKLERGVEITEMAIQGLTLLGVKPAVKGAKARVLEFSSMLDEANKILKFEEQPSLDQSLFGKFDVEFAKNVQEKFPKVWSMYGNVKGDKNFENYQKALFSEVDQDLSNWISEREDWAIKHAKESSANSLIAQMKMGVVCLQGEDFHKSAILEQIKIKYPEFSEKEEKANMQEDEKDLSCGGTNMEDDVAEPNEGGEKTSDEPEEKEKEVEIEVEMAKLQAELDGAKAELEEVKQQNAVYMEELGLLRQFKADFEKKEEEAKLQADNEAKLSKIEEVLKDPKVVTTLSADEIETYRVKANDYNLDTIDAWANEVKVVAFSKIDLTKPQTKKDTYTRFSTGGEKTEPQGESKWRFKNK